MPVVSVNTTPGFLDSNLGSFWRSVASAGLRVTRRHARENPEKPGGKGTFYA